MSEHEYYGDSMSNLWFKQLETILSKTDAIAYVWDVDADCLEWAGNLEVLLGLPADDWPQNNYDLNKLINPQDVAERLNALHDTVQDDEAIALMASYRMKKTDGSFVGVQESATLQTDNTGKRVLSGLLTFEEPKKQDHTDNVMGLRNMHGGRGWLQSDIDGFIEAQHAQHRRMEGYLLVVGIDFLHLYNESLGTVGADEIIFRLGDILRQIVPSHAKIHRINGDVFGILFPEGQAFEMVSSAQHIIRYFNTNMISIQAGSYRISVSVGGSHFLQDSPLGARNNALSFIDKAETAMRAAKDKGRNCFMSYSEIADIKMNNLRLLKSGDEFLQALKDDRVFLAYQPVVKAGCQQVSFHESLVRIFDPSGQQFAAGYFIEDVEKLGLCRLVDQFAFRTAIQELREYPELELSVNVSKLTLNDKDWLRDVVSALRDNPDIANRLIIEITEGAVIQDAKHVIRVVRTLRELGCRVALDDFGAGHTAFTQMRELDIDIVKIDKSFVRQIREDNNHLFIRALQSLAEGIDIKTVGEGAETLCDASTLAADGIDYIQGYAFGIPAVERVWLPDCHDQRKIIVPRHCEVKSGIDKILSRYS